MADSPLMEKLRMQPGQRALILNPKTETDLNREVMWELITGTGWRPVTQVSIDKVWSALRFRPSDRVSQR